MIFNEFYNKLNKLDYKTWLLFFLGYMNIRDGEGWTPLIFASRNGDIKVVKLLLLNGANIESRNKYGCTPLMHACSNSFNADDNIKTIKLLLDYGANIEAKDKDDCTPLMYALQYCGSKIIKLLLDYGANIEAKDKDGYTSLHTAITWNRYNIAELLLKAGADPNTMDNNGKTISSKIINSKIEKLIKSYGAK